MALAILSTLAVLSAVVMSVLGNRYRLAFQTAAWQEALLAAESGLDMGIAELRTSLYNPNGAFTSWTHTDGTLGGPSGGETSTTSNILLRTGEGGQRSWAKIEVAAPAELRDARGTQWYRIRSTGYAEVPGIRAISGDPLDVNLRKLDFYRDHRTQQVIARPQASRRIEAVVKPVGTFRVALLGDKSISMNNQNIVVDSYDSRNSAKSTNGFYDPTKRQTNGDIATNGPVIDAGNAYIYGDASTNGGTVLNSGNVTGQIRDDFYQELFKVTRPVMTPTAGTPSSVVSSTSIAAAPNNPTMVILSTIKLSGQNTLRITGASDGSTTYAQILVNGDASLSGQAQIILDPGVKVRMFIVGDATLTGQGVANPNDPLSFQLYGVERLPDSNGNISTGSLKVAGNGGFRGAVYAPNYDLTMVGGGNTDSIFGSFVGNSATMTGVQSIHYDEAMGEGGLVADYRVISWFEDNK